MRVFITGSMKHVLPILEALIQTRHKVTVMCNDHRECEQLADLTDRMIICGDPTKREAQEEARIRNFDMVVALTEKDADNLIICDIAKRHFGVRRSFASVECPALEAVFERLGVDEAQSYDRIASDVTGALAWS